MSERYFITGVQLGLLQALPKDVDRKKIYDEIVNKQFICNAFGEQAQKEFKIKINKLIKDLEAKE